MKTYRGSAAAARAYVEADRSRADDYYLAEGTGLAGRYVATFEGVRACEEMDGATYEQWVAGVHVDTGTPKGRLRDDDHAVRFVEVTVNGPKTWSLAAAMHPEIADAYDAAQQRAAVEIIGWLAEHATTRLGPRGRQVQVPVDEIEAAVVRHYTSRAGDPHRHLHLQINARVLVSTGSSNGPVWRGLHTVGVRDSLGAINGIGHAAVMADPGFRAALAARGYHLDGVSGEVAELAPYVGAFSARSLQIELNIDRYEAEWRGDHPGEEPGQSLRQIWDRRAWADARPDKVVPESGADLLDRWGDELRAAGFAPPSSPAALDWAKPAAIDPAAIIDTTLIRLASQRSAWNAADIRGEVERGLAAAGLVTDGAVRREVAEHLTEVAASRCVPLLGRTEVPEHVRAMTSAPVLAVEKEIVGRMIARVDEGSLPAFPRWLVDHVEGLDTDQVAVVAQVAGVARLSVVEGAAGSGKTATLAALRAVSLDQGHRMVVVTPTRKAALVAEGQIGAASYPVAWLLHQHGFRWDDDGRWTRVPSEPDVAARMRPEDLIVVDEAGMLDQDTARALLTLADEQRVRVALVGDRHQLPAVGRGGVLDLAARHAPLLSMEGLHRFADPEYARLSLTMRLGEHAGEVFDELMARGEVVLHASDVEREMALAVAASKGELVVADTRQEVARINGLAHQVRVATGEAADGVVTASGERLGVGDRIATRRNDREIDVANRETWTVVDVEHDGVVIDGAAGRRRLPLSYVRDHVELAYATTAHGAQGTTVDVAHVLVGEHTGASSAYVGMTRGRERNVAHLVADSVDDARQQWIDVFERNRADLGPAHAALRAADEVERYGVAAPTRRRRPEPVPRRSEEPVVYGPTPSRDYGIGI